MCQPSTLSSTTKSWIASNTILINLMLVVAVALAGFVAQAAPDIIPPTIPTHQVGALVVAVCVINIIARLFASTPILNRDAPLPSIDGRW